MNLLWSRSSPNECFPHQLSSFYIVFDQKSAFLTFDGNWYPMHHLCRSTPPQARCRSQKDDVRQPRTLRLFDSAHYARVVLQHAVTWIRLQCSWLRMLNEASNKFTSRRVLLRFMQILRTRCVETCHEHEQGGVDVPTMQPAAHAPIKIFFIQSHPTKFSRYHPWLPVFVSMELHARYELRQQIRKILMQFWRLYRLNFINVI